MPFGDGEEFGMIDATLAHRVGESLMCRALAGPQPRGVDATSTTPMTASVSTVTDTAATMRWACDPRIISPLAYLCARPCYTKGHSGGLVTETPLLVWRPAPRPRVARLPQLDVGSIWKLARGHRQHAKCGGHQNCGRQQGCPPGKDNESRRIDGAKCHDPGRDDDPEWERGGQGGEVQLDGGLVGDERRERSNCPTGATTGPERANERNQDPDVCRQAEQTLGRGDLQRLGVGLVDLLGEADVGQSPVAALERRIHQPEVA